jgi:hypothetical protein
VVLLLLGIFVAVSLVGKKTDTVANGPDPYAAQLAITGLELSQSSNIAGSQITYVDGQITNQGNRTVNGVSVETTFLNAAKQSADKQIGLLSLIRTRQPYVDIESVSADPIKPGETKPFRLIFDKVSPDWDQQNLEIRVIQVRFK